MGHVPMTPATRQTQCKLTRRASAIIELQCCSSNSACSTAEIERNRGYNMADRTAKLARIRDVQNTRSLAAGRFGRGRA